MLEEWLEIVMARLYNGMTEEEILAAGKTFCLGTPEVARGASAPIPS